MGSITVQHLFILTFLEVAIVCVLTDQEQELEARARAMQRKSPSTVATTASWYNWKDDDRNGPPGSCGGGGGLGGLDTSGSRFIF